MSNRSESNEALEAGIDELLNGGLDAAGAAEIARRIAHDPAAYEALREAVRLRHAARKAFGLAQTDEWIRASLGELNAQLQVTPVPATTAGRRRSLWQRAWRPSVLSRVAALVVIAAAIFVSVTVHRTARPAATLAAPVGMPTITREEVARLQTVWRELREDSGRSTPWLLLTNAAGEFGYISPAADGTVSGGLVLVRCVLIDQRGASVGTANLLVPAHGPVQLSVPEGIHAGGRTINYEAHVEGAWATVGLSVGDTPVGGLRGRTPIGREPVEIGQFLLDGEPLRVVLQAMPFSTASS